MLVRLSADEGAAATWAMIELQGEVERKDGGSMEEAFDVGTLAVTSSVSCPDQVVRRGGERAAASACSAVACLPTSPSSPAAPLSVMQGAVMLTIGYHQVEGKRMELKKPYAVLNRMRGGGTDRSAGGGSTSGGGGEGQKAGGEGEEEDGGAAPEYKVQMQSARRAVATAAAAAAFGSAAMPCRCSRPRALPPPSLPGTLPSSAPPQVVGVVRERILFKTRPRALITKPGGEGGSK